MCSTEMKATCKNSANLEQETKTTKIVTYPLLSLASSILLRKSDTTFHCRLKDLRRNPPDVGVTSGQKPCTKIIYIVLQTSVGLF